MLRKKLWNSAAVMLLALALAGPACAAPRKAASKSKPAESVEAVQKKLDAFAEAHLARAAKTLRPNRKFVEVRKQDGRYVAWFSELDAAGLTTELHDSGTPGCQYVGHVIYHETVYTCTADTEAEARKGPFKASKVRRIRELTRYDKGKWHY